MSKSIIHLIDSSSMTNFGIWNAALEPNILLSKNYGVSCFAWFADHSHLELDFSSYSTEALIAKPEEIISLIQNRFEEENTIIMSHGCWKLPTRIGAKLKKTGFKWVYVPHGMLEPWSRKQKKIKKDFYYRLLEKPAAKKADSIRAVGKPEFNNLKKEFKNLDLIPNGVRVPEMLAEKPEKITFLFMARLHHKKGIIPLVNAWVESVLANDPDYELNIAGPDDGELDKLNSVLSKNLSNNIRYLGPVYGADKENLLKASHFYVLPTLSEGFPTSILEAMAHKCLVLSTEGANFPELFDKNIGLNSGIRKDTILNALVKCSNMSSDRKKEIVERSFDLIRRHYSTKVIADKLFEIF